jgi:hypothetical protein
MIVLRCLPYIGSGGEKRRAFFGVLGTSTKLHGRYSVAIQRPLGQLSYYSASPQWLDLEVEGGSPSFLTVLGELERDVELREHYWATFVKRVHKLFRATFEPEGPEPEPEPRPIRPMKLKVGCTLFTSMVCSG